MVKNKKNNKKPRTQKQQIADLEKNMLDFKKEMIGLVGDLVKSGKAFRADMEDLSGELTKQVVVLKDEMVGLQGGVDLICNTFREQGVAMGLSMQKVYDGFERVQGIIDEKMFYASEDAKKLTKSETPKKEKTVTPGKLPAPVTGKKKDISYTDNVRQFRALEGLEMGLYDIIVAGRFGDEIRVKPYDKHTGKNYVSQDQFKELAQALAAKGFGRKAGYDGYFSNKIKPQRQRNDGGGYRRDYRRRR